jgi:carbohydrate-selective porin OprB
LATLGSVNTTPYHLELFYRYRVNKNISITHGVFWVFNPEGVNTNPTATVGVIRTTFSF